MSAADGAAKAGRREWIGLAVLALPCMLYSMDLTVLNLAVPHLTADLGPSAAQLLWIVDIYGFLIAGFLVTMGTLGDRIGRRRLLLMGAAAFGAASVLAACSRSAGMLIAARALLGVAAATLAPSTLSLLRNMFVDDAERTFAIGVWVTSFSLGAAIGPLVGGAVLERFGWGAVFLIGVPVMALLLVSGPRLLPEFRNPVPGRIDLASAGLSLLAVLAAIHGLKQISHAGLAWTSASAVGAGLVLGALFVRRQLRLPDPLIDLRLFRMPAFSAALATNALDFFTAFGSMLFVAQCLQLVVGFSPWQAGVWTVPSSGAFIAGSLLTPLIVRRVRPGFLMAAGLAVAALGFGVFTRMGESPGLPVLVAGSVVVSLGLAPVTTLATDIMVGAAPPDQAGMAAAMSETSSEFGGALGIAVLGSMGSSVYRGTLSAMAPSGVPHGVREAARDTLGGAIAAAERLPAQAGLELVDAARAAFVQAFEFTSAICAAIALAAAVLAAVLLRHVGARTRAVEAPSVAPLP